MFLFWAFVSLILGQFYGSFLYAFLTIPKTEPPLDSVDDLERALRSNQYWLYTHEKFGLRRDLVTRALTGEQGLLGAIGNEIIRFGTRF